MQIMKYIISDTNVPVLFSKDLLHNEVIQNVKSAGFLSIKYNTVKKCFTAKCFGESSSLKIASNAAEDKKIIEDFFNKQL